MTPGARLDALLSAWPGFSDSEDGHVPLVLLDEVADRVAAPERVIEEHCTTDQARGGAWRAILDPGEQVLDDGGPVFVAEGLEVRLASRGGQDPPGHAGLSRAMRVRCSRKDSLSLNIEIVPSATPCLVASTKSAT